MTTMTISTITNSHDPKNKKSLSHLWQEIEKKQQRNARYQAKLDDFYVYFKKRAEEDEQSVCFATETWITHLLSFIPRKTIKGAQRESLYVWIEEEISILESNPFNPVDSQPLRKAFMELHSPLILTNSTQMKKCTKKRYSRYVKSYKTLSVIISTLVMNKSWLSSMIPTT
ncbi:hypothetical protein [Photobacterium aquimaris]|uniref:hypothetical protein n=1 Tax=Photobacterium aquimaris TaxID=512643 RepID=UPI001F1F57FB|nr:hypothetical protein [Photobacterium aquimaris]